MSLISDAIRVTRIVAGNAGKRLKLYSENDLANPEDLLYTLPVMLLGPSPDGGDPIRINISDPADKTRLMEFDKKFKAPFLLEVEHHEIHEGDHYFICDFESGVAQSALRDFVVTVPNTSKDIHMIFFVKSTGGVSMTVYEGSSDVVGGTPVIPLNNNRKSANTSILTVLANPSSITTGSRLFGQASGSNKEAGEVSRSREIILKNNTTYLFRIQSLAAANLLNWCGEWYEHIPE